MAAAHWLTVEIWKWLIFGRCRRAQKSAPLVQLVGLLLLCDFRISNHICCWTQASSKSTITPLLEKSREQMPPPSAPPSKKSKPKPEPAQKSAPEPAEEPVRERESRPKQPQASKQKRLPSGVRGGLSPESFQSGGLTFWKFDKNSTDLWCLIIKFGGLGALFGG